MIDICLICARKGSKEVKNKNIRKILNIPLIGWSIKQALGSRLFENVYVSTDCRKIAKISKRFGADVPFIRSQKLSGDNVSKFLVWKDALAKIENITKKKIRYVIDLDCTNPIRTRKDIYGVIKMMKKNKKADAVITISKSRRNPYFNMVEKLKKGSLVISKKSKKKILSRQKAPGVFDIVANVYCIKADFLKKSKNLFDGKIYGYEIDQKKSIDIDTHHDLQIVKMFIKKLNKNV